MTEPRAHRVPGRHTQWHLVRRRHMLLRAGTAAALLAVVGPGVLAGLSDDDPAGITTYSILGARYGYELLWVLALSTAALIVFHEVGVRLGVVTGKGLLTLVRERFGIHAAVAVAASLVIANTGTMCAEFAGVAAGMELLGGMSRYLSVPLAALGISALVLRGSFRYVEHFLLALSSVFIAYVVAGILAHPDWGAAAKGLVVPSIPLNRDALLVAVATLGTTLAPWGLAFIQSYAVDKRLALKDLRYERVDVIVGAALLAAAIVPLSTAYSVSETLGRRADLNDSFEQARTFYLSFGAVVAVAALLVLIPGAPLIQILFLSQALNAVLLLVLLPFIRSLAKDEGLMGANALGRFDRVATAVALVLVAISVLALGVLALL